MQKLCPVGEIIDNRFRVISQLGEGGFGSVYLAEQIGFDRKAAVKLVHISVAGNEELLARFEREGRILAGLHHKHIVCCYAHGFWRNKVPYLALEYIEGVTLHTRLGDVERIPWQKSFEYAVQVCSALTELHRNGVIHRDLKPDNIMLTTDEVVKLIDFGLVSIDGQRLTKTGSVVGSLFYISPEQAFGRAASPESDVYALGCVLYHLMAGVPPFCSDVPGDILRMHATVEAEPLSKLDATIPPGVDRVIARAMAKDPNDRYPTAAKLAEDLAFMLQHETVVVKSSLSSKHPASPYIGPNRKRSVNYRFAIATVVIAGLVLAVSAYLLNSKNHSTQAELVTAEIEHELEQAAFSREKIKSINRDDTALTLQWRRLPEMSRDPREIKKPAGQPSDPAELQLFQHLNKARELASTADISDVLRAKLMLAFFKSWLDRPLSLDQQELWLIDAVTLLDRKSISESYRQKLIDACDEIRLNLSESQYEKLHTSFNNRVQSPHEPFSDSNLCSRFETILRPLVANLKPGHQLPSRRWSLALRNYGKVLACTGRPREALSFLLPFYQSHSLSPSERIVIGEAIVSSQIILEQYENALATLNEMKTIDAKSIAPISAGDEQLVLFYQRIRPRHIGNVAQRILDLSFQVRHSGPGDEWDLQTQLHQAELNAEVGNSEKALSLFEKIRSRCWQNKSRKFEWIEQDIFTLIASGQVDQAETLMAEVKRGEKVPEAWSPRVDQCFRIVEAAVSLQKLKNEGKELSSEACDRRNKLRVGYGPLHPFHLQLTRDNLRACGVKPAGGLMASIRLDAVIDLSNVYDLNNNPDALISMMFTHSSVIYSGYNQGTLVLLMRLAAAYDKTGERKQSLEYANDAVEFYCRSKAQDRLYSQSLLPDLIGKAAEIAWHTKDSDPAGSKILCNRLLAVCKVAAVDPPMLESKLNLAKGLAANGHYDQADSSFAELQEYYALHQACWPELAIAEPRLASLYKSGHIAQAQLVAKRALNLSSDSDDPAQVIVSGRLKAIIEKAGKTYVFEP